MMHRFSQPYTMQISIKYFFFICCAFINQVVSICEMGTVALWEVVSGSKIFEFKNIHEGSEVTAACFDASMRRLITGSKNGSLKVNLDNVIISTQVVMEFQQWSIIESF